MFGRRGVLKSFGIRYSELQGDVKIQSHAPASQGPNVVAARQAAYLRLHGKRSGKGHLEAGELIAERVEALQAAIQAAIQAPAAAPPAAAPPVPSAPPPPPATAPYPGTRSLQDRSRARKLSAGVCQPALLAALGRSRGR